MLPDVSACVAVDLGNWYRDIIETLYNFGRCATFHSVDGAESGKEEADQDQPVCRLVIHGHSLVAILQVSLLKSGEYCYSIAAQICRCASLPRNLYCASGHDTDFLGRRNISVLLYVCQ